MKKVITTALFGEGNLYAQYIGALVRGCLNLFPLAEDWRLHVFVDKLAAHATLGRLRDAGLIDVTEMGPAPLCWACLWRMIPVFDPEVDYVFCRDIDAAVMPRDRACISEFIASGLVVHNIHDHVQHVDMLGGLCGFRTAVFREKIRLYSIGELRAAADKLRWRPWEVKGVDQDVLNVFLLPTGGPDIFEHRYNGWFGRAGKMPPQTKNSSYAKVSAPTPDVGVVPLSLQWSTDDIARADGLGAHLGCAHYDHVAAARFWDNHGDPEVAEKVAECER